jgi:hypothetical protein
VGVKTEDAFNKPYRYPSFLRNREFRTWNIDLWPPQQMAGPTSDLKQSFHEKGRAANARYTFSYESRKFHIRNGVCLRPCCTDHLGLESLLACAALAVMLDVSCNRFPAFLSTRRHFYAKENKQLCGRIQ